MNPVRRRPEVSPCRDVREGVALAIGASDDFQAADRLPHRWGHVAARLLGQKEQAEMLRSEAVAKKN